MFKYQCYSFILPHNATLTCIPTQLNTHATLC